MFDDLSKPCRRVVHDQVTHKVEVKHFANYALAVRACGTDLRWKGNQGPQPRYNFFVIPEGFPLPEERWYS